MASSLPVQAYLLNLPMVANSSSEPFSQPSMEVSDELAQDMTQPGVQIDPLDSPHPIPWNWVLATQAELTISNSDAVRYYRSQSLVSPDGQYAAYSRIQMDGQPEIYQSHITSVVFVENLQTGDLRTLTASSPWVNHPLASPQDMDMAGTIRILIPISWSKSGHHLLVRQFEGIFGTSDATDFAVVWERQHNRTTTLAPQRVQYDAAVLLGWSQTNPQRILFQAGEFGNERWPQWGVALNGETTLALEDKPVVYGQVTNQVWAGPQAHW